jgi:8-amino-7-oxononanoate synthase
VPHVEPSPSVARFVRAAARRSVSLDDALATELAGLRERDLERLPRTLFRRRGAVVQTDTGQAIDFSSNDYLGLASDPRLAAAATRAIEEHGVGATASRLIAGTNGEHVALEQALAAFSGTERALSFSTGFAANTGTIPALVGAEDIIFADRLNHASLIDGCRSSRAAVHVYEHADVDALRSALVARRAQFRRALIVTDGMFSMDGDTAPLAEIVALAREFDAWTYVDDAHAIGVIGPHGRGSAAMLGVANEIDITIGTLGKAFGAAGAYVAGSAALCTWLLNRARSFVFSTAPMPAQAAAAREGVRIAVAEPERRARVAANAALLRDALRDRGVVTIGTESSHIVPVLIGDAARTAEVGRRLADVGLLIGAVRPPTVPEGTSRLRLTVSAAHTADQIGALAAALAGVLVR